MVAERGAAIVRSPRQERQPGRMIEARTDAPGTETDSESLGVVTVARMTNVY